MSTHNVVRFLPTPCSWPSARIRVRRIPSAPSCRARRYAPTHRSRFAECPPGDRSPQDRDLHSKIYEAQQAFDPARPVAPPGCADTASPNPTRNALGKGLSQSPAPAALQRAVPQPVESLSVAARRVCSFNFAALKKRRRIVAVLARVSNNAAVLSHPAPRYENKDLFSSDSTHYFASTARAKSASSGFRIAERMFSATLSRSLVPQNGSKTS